MDYQSRPEFVEYCNKVDILVKHLKEYLLNELKTSSLQYKVLLREKEGWVEYQVLEWLGKIIQTTYGWSAWDVCMIDVMAILIGQMELYIKDNKIDLDQLNFQTIGESLGSYSLN